MTNSDKIKEALESCIVAEDRGMKLLHFDQAKVAEALKLLSSPAIVGVEPVAMIHNDYDCSVTCSRCGTDGGFSMYDDLDWAKHCPGCGGPISEQVSAKGERTPHPLYIAAQAPQSSPAPVMSREQLTQEAHGYALKHFTKHGYPRQDIVAELASFAEHVLSLSPAQTVTVPEMSEEEMIRSIRNAPIVLVPPAPAYAMSKDYDALYERLMAGEEVLGTCLDVDEDDRVGSIFTDAEIVDGKEHFLAECQRLKVEYLSPAQGVMPQVDKIMEVVDVEPELPDDMPDEMWEACSSSREYMQEALRTVVRLTKEGIRSRLSALLKLPQ